MRRGNFRAVRGVAPENFRRGEEEERKQLTPQGKIAADNPKFSSFSYDLTSYSRLAVSSVAAAPPQYRSTVAVQADDAPLVRACALVTAVAVRSCALDTIGNSILQPSPISVVISLG